MSSVILGLISKSFPNLIKLYFEIFYEMLKRHYLLTNDCCFFRNFDFPADSIFDSLNDYIGILFLYVLPAITNNSGLNWQYYQFHSVFAQKIQQTRY